MGFAPGEGKACYSRQWRQQQPQLWEERHPSEWRKQKWGPCGLKTARESLERKELEKEVSLKSLLDV